MGHVQPSRIHVVGHQVGEPPRAMLIETEETHRLANGVVRQIGGHLLAKFHRSAVVHAHLHRLISRLEVPVDQDPVAGGCAASQRLHDACVVQHIRIHQQHISATAHGIGHDMYGEHTAQGEALIDEYFN